MAQIKVNDKPLGKQASDLIEVYMKTTGLDDPALVVQEMAFTVFELLKVVHKKSKTEAGVPASILEGIVSSFLRFSPEDIEKVIGTRY